MSEIPGPPPGEMGDDNNSESGNDESESNEESIEDWRKNFQEMVDSMHLEGIKLSDESTLLHVERSKDPTPKSPPGEFLPDEIIVGEDGKEYTVNGLLKEKVISRENYLEANAQAMESLRVLDNSFAKGMLALKGVKTEQIEWVVVTDTRLEKDKPYDKGSRKTGVVIEAVGYDGTSEDFRPGDDYPTPVYKLSAANRAAWFPENAQDYPGLYMEHEGVGWELGDYFSLNAEPSYIGKIAMIPNQDQYPGLVGVMLRDRDSASQLFWIPVSDISKPV